MHPSAYGRRSDTAQKRLIASARVIAQALNIENDLAEAIGRVHCADPKIKALMQREALADLLDAAALALAQAEAEPETGKAKK